MMLETELHKKLVEHKQSGLYRQRIITNSPQDAIIQIQGQNYINFCSNNYLGLANNPEIVRSFQKAANEYGIGSGASHLVTGHSQLHQELEEILADFTQRPKALLFSSGYMANLGVITTLLGKEDAIFEDRLNHASLLDAGLLSRATFHRYQHCNVKHLEHKIKKQISQKKLVVSDGVFSMDGNMAPLSDLSKIVERYKNSFLMVDDAHGFGVLGKTGAGSLEASDLLCKDVPILMGTLGKSIGTMGAFVAGTELLIETLIQFARTYMFTTAITPAIAQATITSLSLVKRDTWRRDKLKKSIERFKNGCRDIGIKLMPSITPIQPFVIGSIEKTMQYQAILQKKGMLVSAIRPPSVPKNTSRLRMTINALHTDEHIDRLIDGLSYATKRMELSYP